jgi:oligopeptide/dipeptide ABC transporter ATP-binding protein
MYLGKIMEVSPSDELHTRPIHPYTEALLSAVPVAATGARERVRNRVAVRGDPPSPDLPAEGLSLPSSLSLCNRDLPNGGAPARRLRERARGGLSSPAERRNACQSALRS